MPTINAYYRDTKDHSRLLKLVPGLKVVAARELSCGDINLAADEVSVRVMKVEGGGMLADVELDVAAHAYQGRIARQDEISLALQDYVARNLDGHKVLVWLLLPQLGHSWEGGQLAETGD